MNCPFVILASKSPNNLLYIQFETGDLDILENRINNTKRADDIEVFADSCNLGLTSFICHAETKGLPSNKYTSGVGLVLKRKQENVAVFLIASSAIIALKCRTEGGWGNWREI